MDEEKSLFISAKEENGTHMSFSNYNDEQEPNDNNKQPSSSPTGDNKKSYFRLIVLALVFILLIVLMCYFFIWRPNGNSKTFTDNQIVYHVDYDQDGIEDDVSETDKYDSTKHTSLSDVVMKDEEGNLRAGELAQILLLPTTDTTDASRPYKNVTLTIYKSAQTANMYILQGNYVLMNENNKTGTSYSYTCNISQVFYDQYLTPILKYVNLQTKSSDGKIVNELYFTLERGSYGGLQVESTSSIWSWLWPLISMAIFFFLIYFLYKQMAKSASGGNPMSGFVNNVARKSTGSKTRFSDVAGCDEAKAELVELVDYFHSTDKYTRLGAKLPHGVLLVGPPGTGKTLLAKAVAGEANVPFYSISGSDFVEMYVGVGASRVRSLFKTAKQNAPCLIFIDEIDAVGRQRGAGLGGGNDEREQTLNELLVEMDGFEDNNGIIVMAATNRSDVLDPALTRPGRFDRTITVDYPDRAGRSAILKVHSRNKKLAPDVNFDSIASRTTGFSGADLANIMNDAAILAVRANRSAITTTDIDEAIDRAISGPAKRSHLEPEERRQVAYHESGHAVIGIFLPYSDKVQKITIVPRGRTGGHVLMTPENDRFLLTKNQLLARITGYLGGRTSEEIFFGDVSTGASNDIEVATNLARSMVTEYGMSDLGPIQYEKAGGSVFLGRDYNSTQANYSTQVAYEIDKAVRSIIDTCHEEAKKLLLEHKDDVTLIAETLIENETITADQIAYLLEHRKLPEVDEHKLNTKEDEPENPNNVILYPGYQFFYHELDKIIKSNPSRVVIASYSRDGVHVSDEQFRKAAVTGASDPKRIGVFVIDRAQAERVSMSIESFSEHLESYVGVPVLLIKMDERSINEISSKYRNANQSSAVQRTGVVNEILPSDKNSDDGTEQK